MTKSISVVLLLLLLSCAQDAPHVASSSLGTEDDRSAGVTSTTMSVDTIASTFPIQIGNDKGTVLITGVREFINDTLTSSSFKVSLDGISAYPFERSMGKNDLIDTNGSAYFLDPVTSDHTAEAVVSEITFESVRSNTLYFKARLLNVDKGKEILGRFNLFYATKKKGTIYGWFTDEVKSSVDPGSGSSSAY